MDSLLKLLDLVERELGAVDAHFEFGGKTSDDPRYLAVPMTEPWRCVARFQDAPADRDALLARLRALVEPFADAPEVLKGPPLALAAAKQAELDEELDRLAERTGARAALVIDERSPVIWGCSSARTAGWDLDAMERLRRFASDLETHGLRPMSWLGDAPPDAGTLAEAGVDETIAQRWPHRAARLARIAPEWDAGEWREARQIAVAVGAARAACRGGHAPERVAAHDESWGVFARGFAQIYMLVLIYDGAYSELHAEGPAVRALSHIETLVLSLPPVEPPPKGAKVIALKPRQ